MIWTFGESAFIVCMLGMTWHKAKQRLCNWLTVEGYEYIKQQQKAGHNLIIMAPRFIGLELVWAWLFMEQPMVCMCREPRKNIFHWAIDRRYTQFGCIAVDAQGNTKPLIKMIRNGKQFFYLPDIDPDKTGRFVFAPFFNTPAAIWIALGRISIMARASIIPCIVRQKPSGHYEVRFLPQLTDCPTNNDINDSTVINSRLEQHVREIPVQYFWIHRRFKTGPEGEASLHGRKRGGYN